MILLLSTPYLRITSLGWFVAIWTLPFVGALFFLLTVVRARKTGHDVCYHGMLNAQRQGRNEKETLGMQYDFLPFYSAQSPRLLYDDEFIAQLYLAIDNAQSRIWITTYILSGKVKTTLIEKLSHAHERGVEVRVIVDRIGSGLILAPAEKPLRVEGIPFKVTVMHDSPIKSIFYMEKRLHSKIVIVDDAAIVGAHNLRDEVLNITPASVRNISVAFSGSVVFQLEAVFADLWNKNSKEKLTLSRKPIPEYDKGLFARIIFSDPIERSHKYNAYMAGIFYAAKERICIWMPYVIPTQAMRSTLIFASKIGLDVRLLIPERTDSILVDSAHALVINEMVDNGVKCALSQGRFDHSKVILVDDLAIIGSTNLDYRSLFRNYEANLEIHDTDFSHAVLDAFNENYAKASDVSRSRTNPVIHVKNQFVSLVAGLY